MKKIVILILIVIGLLSAYKFVYLPYSNSLSSNTSNNKKMISVQEKITGQSDFSVHRIEEGKTALDLLNQTESAVTVGENENAYVVGINGIKAEEEKQEFWAFYVNGKQAPIGAGSYKLKSGDKIEWKKENY